MGCQRDTITPLERTDAQYFPLATRQYSIFQVEEIRYSLLNGPDTSRYQLKEVVADSFPGNGGEIIYTPYGVIPGPTPPPRGRSTQCGPPAAT